jgi:hypothetical protein
MRRRGFGFKINMEKNVRTVKHHAHPSWGLSIVIFLLVVLVIGGIKWIDSNRRHVRTTSEAILGHWEAEGVDFYVTPKTITSIYDNGYKFVHPYTIAMSNEHYSQWWIQLYLTDLRPEEAMLKIALALDCQTATTLQYFFGPDGDLVDLTEHWTYKDGKQQP